MFPLMNLQYSKVRNATDITFGYIYVWNELWNFKILYNVVP